MQTLKVELIRLASFTAKVVIVALMVLGTTGLVVALFADDLNDSPYDNKRTISVQGVAKKKIAPDSARVILGKNIRGKDPVAVQNDATAAINKLVAEVKKLGVPDEKIETSNYSLTPVYNKTNNDIESYAISISVTVTLEKTNPKDNMANKVISAGTVSGINEVRGLSFYLSNQEELQRDMEDEAIEDAKEQAEKRAKAAGLKLGDVLSIGGSNFYYYGEDGVRSETGAAAPSAVPSPDKADSDIDIKPGELEIREYVTLVFEVK